MCFIQMDGGPAAPELDRQGRARSARQRHTRRTNDLNEAENNRLGVFLGLDPASGRDFTATIEAARRALQTPTGSPTAAPTVAPPRPIKGLPTIGGS